METDIGFGSGELQGFIGIGGSSKCLGLKN